ncbi:energy transducer TonB [Spirosoma areae]
MRTVSLVFLLTGLLRLPALAQTDSVSTTSREQEVFTVVEQPPQFPGGMQNLGEYLRKNLRYPEAARQAKVEGRVFVNFLVSNQGKIQDVHVLKRVGFGMDEEALRLMQAMPNWIPGRQSGRAVNVRYNLPINFSLR